MPEGMHQNRYEAAVEEMRRAGIWAWNAQPPYVRAARLFGWKPRPPYYQSFWQVLFSYWAYFSFVWGVIMYLFQWRRTGQSLIADCLAALFAGLFFGLGMAAWYRRVRKRAQLTRWEDLV